MTAAGASDGTHILAASAVVTLSRGSRARKMLAGTNSRASLASAKGGEPCDPITYRNRTKKRPRQSV